jgi:two-component system, OmpR family, sensor kinase
VRKGSLRRRFVLGAVASALLAFAIFAVASFVLVITEEQDEPVAGAAAPGESPTDEAIELVLQSMGIALPIGVVAALLMAALVGRRATRPIAEAIAAAQEMTAHDLTRRLPLPAEDGEVRDLVAALNELFARLQEGFGALSRFAADASHELRNPLAVVATELEVALRHPRTPAQWQASASTALTEVQRLSALVDGLLSLARAGVEPPGSRRRLELGALIDEVVAQHQAAAAARTIELVGPETLVVAEVDGNPSTLATAIGNLISNAIRYATTRVVVEIECTPALVIVLIDDDGSGMGADPTALLAPVLRSSGPEAERTGSGLGLAIARRVAEAHGGRLRSERAPLGGARLALELPRGAAAAIAE